MTLPVLDQQYLADRQIPHEVVMDGGMVCVIFPTWQLPAGLSVTHTDVLLRVAAGYPDIPPDMWWTDPEILRADGTVIPATEVREPYFGRTWQRWSRHFQAGQWQSGIDGLESYLALMRAQFLLAGSGRAA
jgi:Prokaryotic E2 family E